jgi:hypothetical protein
MIINNYTEYFLVNVHMHEFIVCSYEQAVDLWVFKADTVLLKCGNKIILLIV